MELHANSLKMQNFRGYLGPQKTDFEDLKSYPNVMLLILGVKFKHFSLRQLLSPRLNQVHTESTNLTPNFFLSQIREGFKKKSIMENSI